MRSPLSFTLLFLVASCSLRCSGPQQSPPQKPVAPVAMETPETPVKQLPLPDSAAREVRDEVLETIARIDGPYEKTGKAESEDLPDGTRTETYTTEKGSTTFTYRGQDLVSEEITIPPYTHFGREYKNGVPWQGFVNEKGAAQTVYFDPGGNPTFEFSWDQEPSEGLCHRFTEDGVMAYEDEETCLKVLKEIDPDAININGP